MIFKYELGFVAFT